MSVEWRDVPGPDGLKLRAKLERDHYGRTVVTGLVVEGRPIRADDLRQIRIADIEAEPFDDISAGLPPLRRTSGMVPEEFSRLVAEHYRHWARFTPHPATAMATEYGVKLPTVHTWIREARLRGHLPAAQRGKAASAQAQ